MVKMIALKSRPVHGHRVKVGDTYEVTERDAKLLRKMRFADLAPEGSADPIFVRGTYKRRDIPAAPARMDMRATPDSPRSGRVVSGMGTGSGLSAAPPRVPGEEDQPAPRRRGRPRKVRPAEEPGDEGETE